ncbi:DNA polymerase III subunit gamma/tau [Leptolyngbya cf. ectocarpi LEGE 11479]|uniref:DNA polymerase III subunit gamma/tau n=1 Tax=Leptolyngbya cf. ectocarpi LEGE 11479 TaxID=1828722 RepID=A0A928ZPE8_LEPEC|nr:DNA polymerase III subunit gamma/tau [Leptolyngbya ectocarpi]MBE9065110.1 DNA polymerase III subunit gamma/tau [Leptolyngbya cf. ectocarpi LEGE 11479]
MAYEPLHHKYRPQTFAQLVGQGAIATTLSNALQQNRIAPAYLFCGPRGTGKTSSARILAKSLNCLSSEGPTPEPCGQCQVCREITVGASLDIIEIDAASNTGVDNIRELIERAQFAPVQCRHKLYVLDEVHMLSTAAFNALLKTLEEPPPHVVFVLATTDPQRVLPTIISRCQRFDFRRIPLDAMVHHLDYIAQQEAIAIAPDALQLVAQLSQGGLRDAESLLDQLGLMDGEITIEAVWDLVGAVSERDLLALVQAVGADDGAQVLILARQLMDRGREPLMVLQSLVAFYRDLLIAKTAGERRDLVAITAPIWAEMVPFAQALPLSLLLSSQQHLRAAEVQVKNTTQPRLWLEITLMGLLPSAQGHSGVAAPSVTAVTPVPAVPPIKPLVVAPPAKKSSLPAVEPARQPEPQQPLKSSVPPSQLSQPAQPSQPNKAEPLPAPRREASSPNKNQPTPSQKMAEAPAMGSLNDIWAKIVTQMMRMAKSGAIPMGTAVLMRQHGQLLACDGVEADVGITNDKLMQMAQNRLSNVEAAFEQVFGHKLRVAMVVAPGTGVAEPAAALATPVPRSSVPAPPVVPVSPVPASAGQPVSPPKQPSQPSHDASPASPAPTTAVTAHPVDPPSVAEWQTESDLERSVKSFAQFFNGQIVNLDDETEPTDSGDSDKPSTKPGPDVPF